jgi:hypothetical protein
VNTLVFFTHKHTPSPNSGILEVDFQARDTYDGKVIEKVFGNRKHRLLLVYVNDFNDAYSSEECAEWMQAFQDTLDSKVSPDSYENPYIGEMFELIEEDKITPDERARMKEENNLEEGQRDARQEGREEGIKEGLEAGREECLEAGLEEAARKLLVAGNMSAEQIANVIGLPLKRVKAKRR